jgi:hypothetical protein
MAITFIIHGQHFLIDSLERSLDQEFVNLYAAFLGNSTYEWSSFETAAHNFFSQPTVDGHQHGQFFNNFTILWKQFLQKGQIDKAEQIWKLASSTAWNWETSNPGREIHKGALYYFWGLTAIIRGDLDRGYALMHQALEEDVRESGNEFPDKPALALATMNAEKLEQAAHSWVAYKAHVAKRFLETYRSETGNRLDFSLLNSKFLQHPPHRHVVYSLSYVLARLAKLSETPKQILNSAFAAQLNMDLILRLLQVIEVSLKQKLPNSTNMTFMPLVRDLSQNVGLTLTGNDLQYTQGEAKRDFENTLSNLLDNNLSSFPSGTLVTGLNRDLAVAYICRNYAAHQLYPSATIQHRYNEIQQAVFNTFFIIVEKMY